MHSAIVVAVSFGAVLPDLTDAFDDCLKTYLQSQRADEIPGLTGKWRAIVP